MASEKIHLEIVTPERQVLKEEVDEVQIPGKDGYLGVLPGHAPLITMLSTGEVSYRKEKMTYFLAVDSGYCEVLSEKVTVLAEKAERAEDIDLKRAEAAKSRAEKRLSDIQNQEINFARATASLQRALSRIRAHEKSQGSFH
jgi:F-type H+-transporting ATPase subunit epsilon